MAFTREDVAAYEQQPQTQVELPTSVVEVAADLPVEPVVTDATPAADDADADVTAAGESSAEEVDGDPATPSGEPSAATEPAKGSARARIMELVDERNAYKKFGSVAEQRIADLEARLAASEGKKPAAPAAETPAVATDTATDDDPAPSPEDADVQYDPVKLSQKTAKWLKAQVDKGVTAGVAKALNTDKSATAAVAARQAFDARVEAFEKTPDGKDFRVRLSAKDLPKLPPPVGHKIGTDEMGPAILNVIAVDVASAKEFAALPIEDQLVRIGEIKADLKAKAKAAPAAAVTPAAAAAAAKPVKQPKTVSTAPPPPTRVPAGANSQKRSLTDPSLSMDDFVRLDREEANAARAAKRAQRGLR